MNHLKRGQTVARLRKAARAKNDPNTPPTSVLEIMAIIDDLLDELWMLMSREEQMRSRGRLRGRSS